MHCVRLFCTLLLNGEMHIMSSIQLTNGDIIISSSLEICIDKHFLDAKKKMILHIVPIVIQGLVLLKSIFLELIKKFNN